MPLVAHSRSKVLQNFFFSSHSLCCCCCLSREIFYYYYCNSDDRYTAIPYIAAFSLFPCCCARKFIPDFLVFPFFPLCLCFGVSFDARHETKYVQFFGFRRVVVAARNSNESKKYVYILSPECGCFFFILSSMVLRSPELRFRDTHILFAFIFSLAGIG